MTICSRISAVLSISTIYYDNCHQILSISLISNLMYILCKVALVNTLFPLRLLSAIYTYVVVFGYRIFAAHFTRLNISSGGAPSTPQYISRLPKPLFSLTPVTKSPIPSSHPQSAWLVKERRREEKIEKGRMRMRRRNGRKPIMKAIGERGGRGAWSSCKGLHSCRSHS